MGGPRVRLEYGLTERRRVGKPGTFNELSALGQLPLHQNCVRVKFPRCLTPLYRPRSVFWLSGLRSGSGQFCFDVRDEVVEHLNTGCCDEREAAIMA